MATTTSELALPPAAGVLERTRQRDALLVGAALYGLATLVCVAGLIGAYLAIRSGQGWPPEGVKKQNYLGAINVAAALFLLPTGEWIVWAVRNEERRQAAQATGLAFLFVLGMFNSTLTTIDRAGFGAGSHGYAVFFYAFLVVNLATSIAALIALAVHGGKLFARQVSAVEHQVSRAVSITVHVSAITWLMTWCALYAASR